ncbi:transglutaminaseTgpA domain-containing protein [Paenibacillus sp. FSL W7-1287]|uniref:transglutaminaseTgpA domain-containing protein n=1 Tax=Paenibacillus sp. FSL W7-1287 TaxID=2954538 RepID=UPI0030FC910C
MNRVGSHFLRLLPLLAVLFIVDILSVFQGYWWKDTYRSIYWTLSVITVINLIFPKRPMMLRIPMDLCIAVFVTFRVTWHRQPEVVERFIERIPTLSPFIEITMAVVLILLLLERFVVNKRRLIIVFAIGLLIITIRDSFSPLKLWMNVILLVVIFLLWHTILHYRSLDHSTFSKLMKRPHAVFVPFVTVLAVITMIAISLPHGPPLLEDPYALWKKSKGESVPAFLGNKGYGGGSTPDLNTSSGYSRDSSQLGGGFNYDYSPALTVTTSHKGYLKGETKAFYDGKGWIDDKLGTERSIRLQVPIDPPSEPLADYSIVEQKVIVHREEQQLALFSNGDPQMLTEMQYDASNPNEEQRIELLPDNYPLDDYTWNDTTSSLVSAEQERYLPITSYTLASKALIIDQQGLKEAKAEFGELSSLEDEEARQAYLSVPDIVPARVHELAVTVTEAGKNDYERALLLEQHLRMNYSYTNKPDLSLLTGESEDFVDQFLFELQQGYCDYFSTAMVMMARTLGMPARWVIGYTAGSNNIEEMYESNPYMIEQMLQETSGTFTIRNSDAHSWVEIYFDGYGWVSFEPTPGFSMPLQFGAEEEVDLLSDLLLPPVSGEDTLAADEGWSLTDAQRNLIWWSCALLLIAVTAFALIRYRKQVVLKLRNFRYISYTDNQIIVLEINRLLNKGKRIGLPVGTSMTMREMIEHWKAHYPQLKQTLEQLLVSFEAAQYSKNSMTSKDVEQVREHIQRVKKVWRSKN